MWIKEQLLLTRGWREVMQLLLRSPGGAFVPHVERDWVKKIEDSTMEPQCPNSPRNTCYWLSDDHTCYLCLPQAVMQETVIHLDKKKIDHSIITSTYWATRKRLTNQSCSVNVKPCSTSASPWEEHLFDFRGFTSYSRKQCWVWICPHANSYPEAYPSRCDSLWTWSPREFLSSMRSGNETLMLGLAPW